MAKRESADEEREEIDVPSTDLGALLDHSEDEKSELDKIFEKMMDPDNIHHNTEVTQEEINGFSTLYAMSKSLRKKGYPLEILEGWLVEQMKLRVSKNRQGRREWVKITTRLNEDSNKKPGLFDFMRRD